VRRGPRVLFAGASFSLFCGDKDEALRYAPNWKQLKQAREAAAKLKT